MEKKKVLYWWLQKLAEKHECSAAQLALAWVLHQGHDVVPIPGTTKIKNLVSNVVSLSVKLTAEDLEEISNVFSIDEVAGERMTEAYDRNTWKFANTPPKNA